MTFLAELILASIKYIIMLGIATCGVFIGIAVRKKKNKKDAEKIVSEE